MRPEFYIYPEKCAPECDTLKNSAKELLGYKNQTENVKKVIAGLSGGGYSNIVNLLSTIITDMETEQKNLENLSTVLEQSIQVYVQTEAKITNTNVNNSKIDTSKNGIDDILANALDGIADIRNNEWGVLFESLLLKGLLTDYTIKDLGKILSGTYLSSYWKDGQFYLKLNYDNLTNSQAGDWLKNNLGGDWDDYLSRNMKNNGFSIFDMENGATRKMRYFDDVTDAELLKYLDDLKSLDHLSFGTAFKNNFNLLDDFDYRDFGELGKLGKVGKVLGTAGTVLTAGGDVIDNFYNPETGTWSFSGNQLADCACDIGIDIGAGAGSAALGAAVGSFIVPPVGTVVGAGVGIAVDFAANNLKIWDVDGDGQKDSAIDALKYGAHELVDLGKNALDSVLDWGSDAISGVGDWFGEAFAF